MLAARDQENLIHGHLQAAAAKSLNHGKATGNKYPKTPLKHPLKDENAPIGLCERPGKGKSIENLATGGKNSASVDTNAFVTPFGPRNRAPLGVKTTNAKAKVIQITGARVTEKELEKTLTKQMSTRRVKKVIHADSTKLEVHGDESPLAKRDVEYCPPKPIDLPYESDTFPDNCLDYSRLQPKKLAQILYRKHCRPYVDENGRTNLEREYEEACQRDAQECDEAVLRMMEEEWTVGDVPETFHHLRKHQPHLQESGLKTLERKRPATSSKGPTTSAARKAASVLSATSKSAPLQSTSAKAAPKASFLSVARPQRANPGNPSIAASMRHAASTANSRSTIGYSKGRSVPRILQQPEYIEPSRTKRSIGGMSTRLDTTITPERFANQQKGQSPRFMKAFNVDDEDLEPGLRGILSESVRRGDDDDEVFVMTLGS